jgi:hypothetical protein
MLLWLYMYVVSVLIWMFHILQCCICFRHMLQASIQKVSSVSDVCCKCVYQDVVVAIHICSKRMFANISPVSDVCRKCFHVTTLAGVRSGLMQM